MSTSHGGDGEGDEREAMRELVRRARQRLAWEQQGGISAMPRPTSRRRLPRRAVETAPPAASQATPKEPAAAAAPPPSSIEQAIAEGVRRALPDAASAPAPERRADTLPVVRADLGDCRRCKLAPLRKNIVFGVGNPSAPLVFVGEAPGENEDLQGEPFVGKAGELLTRMIAAMGFSRDEVYICNVIKCRPPGNRNPEPDEIAACEPFLIRQVGAIAPRVIVTLGKFAAQALLRSEAPISALRGQWKRYQGIALMPTFHPAYLLRNPSAKREVWDDLKQVMAELDRLGIPRRKEAT